ncbi:fatty acid-binding protein type 2-like [Mytilus galloprovincialis]|uniref:fatty acid-binding protein type 2-like n=1 Tax=Mytilus galloprovincialis TaxID=29158 RepID=UPI003F7B60CC
MAQFIGKWKGDASSYTNYDEFAKASEIPSEYVEEFKNAKFEVEFKKDGDMWSCEIKSTAGPDKTYKFKSGEEVTETDMFGKGVKYTITVDSDTKMTEVESGEATGWKTLTVTRVVTGKNMLETIKLEDGTAMTMSLIKVS